MDGESKKKKKKSMDIFSIKKTFFLFIYPSDYQDPGKWSLSVIKEYVQQKKQASVSKEEEGSRLGVGN